jgi:AcrR family transcriptional regulator
MPPKVKYTKEIISETAYKLVEQLGEDALTARNLAAFLGCSTAPIFTAFTSIEEIKQDVKERAYALYYKNIEEAMKKDFPIKAAGLTYVNFAKEHPKLFKLLFMSDVGEITQHYFPGGDIKVEPVVRTAIGSHYDMTDESARKLYNHISIYTHGIAVLFAEGNTTFSDKDVSEMLKEAFFAFKEAIEK